MKIRVARSTKGRSPRLPFLEKAASGISGLDEITQGGLPRGRPTLVCGGPGCGKTLFAMEFLLRGAVNYGEPGVFMSFEESDSELAANVASLGFDLRGLEARRKIAVDQVRVERAEIEETGEYDLEGLFVRLKYAIDSVGAKRVVLDTLESLFSGLPNPAVLRSELRRLFRWLKDHGQTVLITGEKGEGALTRQGLEEYVSDCVIFLDHRVVEQNSTRRLRIIKYRGSTHGTNEYPFLIDQGGISILPLSSLSLGHKASNARVPTGIARLDQMLGGRGYFRGSTVLVSGTAGTGKTSLAAHLAASTCARGERALYFAFEESAPQLFRNMRSIGIDLAPCVERGRLRVLASRPTLHGLEMHLVSMHRAVEDFKPQVVILDPITNLISVGTPTEAHATLTRMIDFLKTRGITVFFTSLTGATDVIETTDMGISSLIDTWLLLTVVREGGERNRTISIVKSRGMAHSNQSAEYRLGARGVEILDTYQGTGSVLTGSARVAQEAHDKEAIAAHEEHLMLQKMKRESRRKIVESQIAALREELASEEAEYERAVRERNLQRERLIAVRRTMATSRQAFGAKEGKQGRRNGGRT